VVISVVLPSFVDLVQSATSELNQDSIEGGMKPQN
jgi:hypothetical protein